MQLAGNRSLDGCLAHFRAPSVGCARRCRHGTGPSTTFSPGPSTIPRISRKPQAVYLRFYFCPRRHGRGMWAKRSRWGGSVALGPRGRPGGCREGGRRPRRRPRGAPRGKFRASRVSSASCPFRAPQNIFQNCPCIVVRVPV